MKRARPKRLPQPTAPDSAEREYYRNLRRYAESFIKKMKKGLKELVPDLKDDAAEALEPITEVRGDSQIRMDANIFKSIQALFDKVKKEMGTEFSDGLLGRWAWSMVGLVNKLSKRNIQKVGDHIGTDIEPFLKDGVMNPYFQNIVEQNVGLIRSIGADKLPELQNKLIVMITADAPHGEIADAIEAHFGVTRNKAKLIASDQVGKLNGKIDEYRLKSLGFERYKWRGSLDERERPDHKRLEGKIFFWDKPPVVNRKTGLRANPKGDYRCRCWAEPIIEDVVD